MMGLPEKCIVTLCDVVLLLMHLNTVSLFMAGFIYTAKPSSGSFSSVMAVERRTICLYSGKHAKYLRKEQRQPKVRQGLHPN